LHRERPEGKGTGKRKGERKGGKRAGAQGTGGKRTGGKGERGARGQGSKGEGGQGPACASTGKAGFFWSKGCDFRAQRDTRRRLTTHAHRSPRSKTPSPCIRCSGCRRPDQLRSRHTSAPDPAAIIWTAPSPNRRTGGASESGAHQLQHKYFPHCSSFLSLLNWFNCFFFSFPVAKASKDPAPEAQVFIHPSLVGCAA